MTTQRKKHNICISIPLQLDVVIILLIMIRERMLVVKIQVEPYLLHMQLNVNYTKQIRDKIEEMFQYFGS